MATLALFGLTTLAAEPILSVVSGHLRSQWFVVGILDVLQFSLHQLKFGLALNA